MWTWLFVHSSITRMGLGIEMGLSIEYLLSTTTSNVMFAVLCTKVSFNCLLYYRIPNDQDKSVVSISIQDTNRRYDTFSQSSKQYRVGGSIWLY